MNAHQSITRTLSVRINTPLAGKNFESPKMERTLPPGMYPAQLTKSTLGTRWLVIEVADGHYGWPERAIGALLERDALRIYLNEKEIDSLNEL